METGFFGSLIWTTDPTDAKAPMSIIPRAPAPYDQSPEQEAKFLLRAASEIEHGLAAQYLYAAYSVSDPRFSQLSLIAVEEMGHLLYVQNLILLFGQPPFFDRQDFNLAAADHGPFPYPFLLEPASLSSLATYTVAESPDRALLDSATQARFDEIASNAPNGGALIRHVGRLYTALYWLFKTDDTPPTAQEWNQYPTQAVLDQLKAWGRTDWHLKNGAFADAPDVEPFMATDDEGWDMGRFSVEGIKYVGGRVDRGAILAKLSKIAAEGEGAATGDNSHFERFLGMAEAFNANPPVVASVPISPSTAPSAGPVNDNVIDDLETNLWAQLFNCRYQMVLLELSLALNTRRDTAATLRGTLRDTAISSMRDKLSILGRELPKYRRHQAGNEAKAGAPFELPSGALPIQPAGQRDKIRELALRSQQLVSEIQAKAVDPANPTNRALLADVIGDDGDLLKVLGLVPLPSPAALAAAAPAARAMSETAPTLTGRMMRTLVHETVSAVVPDEFDDVSNYTFRSPKDPAWRLTVNFADVKASRDPGHDAATYINQLGKLYAQGGAALESISPIESNGLSGLVVEYRCLDTSPSAAPAANAQALPKAYSVRSLFGILGGIALHVDYAMSADETLSDETFAHVARSIRLQAPADTEAPYTPSRFIRRVAGPISLDVPHELQAPANLQVASRDGRMRFNLRVDEKSDQALKRQAGQGAASLPSPTGKTETYGDISFTAITPPGNQSPREYRCETTRRVDDQKIYLSGTCRRDDHGGKWAEAEELETSMKSSFEQFANSVRKREGR